MILQRKDEAQLKLSPLVARKRNSPFKPGQGPEAKLEEGSRCTENQIRACPRAAFQNCQKIKPRHPEAKWKPNRPGWLPACWAFSLSLWCPCLPSLPSIKTRPRPGPGPSPSLAHPSSSHPHPHPHLPPPLSTHSVSAVHSHFHLAIQFVTCLPPSSSSM